MNQAVPLERGFQAQRRRVAGVALLAAAAVLGGCATIPAGQWSTGEQARQEVIAAEKAFARTMADRDLAAFGRFLSDEAVFFSGPRPLHGRQAVVDFWSRFYARPEAPFSWAPDEVEVVQGGRLAHSAGPVHDPQGKLIGRFYSVWRQEAPGQWRVVFDRGGEACDCRR